MLPVINDGIGAIAAIVVLNYTMPTNAELAKRIEELESLVAGLASKLEEKAEKKGEVDELRESVDFMSGQFDDLLKGREELVTSNKALVASNKELVAKNEALEKRLANIEQYSRLNNVEIKGVPVTKGENCLAILAAIGDAVDCPVSSGDLDIVHRVPTKGEGMNIIARFCSRDKKNDFARKARKARVITSQIGFSDQPHNPVYVNDHLTYENKKLFAQALALKKAHSWQFLWTDNCQIKARKMCDSKVFRISSEADLRIFT